MRLAREAEKTGGGETEISERMPYFIATHNGADIKWDKRIQSDHSKAQHK